MRKLIHMSLIIIITVMAALFLFAPAKTYSVNKKLPFKAKKYCMTAILAQPLRAALDATKIGKLIPLYCSCGKSSNTVDSSLTWMNEKGTFNIAMNSKTQSELEKKLKDEVLPKLKEAVKQQQPMIKTATPADVDKLMTVFRTLRSTMTTANALSYASNYDSSFANRFKEYTTAYTNMSDVEKNLVDQWRKVMDALMKSMNVLGKNFDEEQKLRDNIVTEMLKTYTGAVQYAQTHLAQLVGMQAAQSDVLINRTSEQVNSLAEACISCMEANKAYKQAAQTNVTLIGKKAAETSSSNSSYRLGF